MLLEVTFLALLLSFFSEISRMWICVKPSAAPRTLELALWYVLRVTMAKFMIVNGLVKL